MDDLPDSAKEFIEKFKVVLRTYLVNDVPDEFFAPGREIELKTRVAEVVDGLLVRDKVPIGRELRIELVESILRDIEQARREREGR